MKKPQRPPQPAAGEAITIQPGSYPVLAAGTAMRLSRALRDREVTAEAVQVLAASSTQMRGSVLECIERMELAAKGGDFAKVYHESHEIRGLAGNAGLSAAARIANELCRYLDAVSEKACQPEQPVVRLHMGAISRAARAEDDATRLGEAVARELAQLVNKKLGEINDLETRQSSPEVTV